MRFAFAVLTLILLSGCTSMATLTAGEVGCPASEVQVSARKLEGILQTTTWTAECRGKTFVCTDHLFTGTRCREALTAAPQSPTR